MRRRVLAPIAYPRHCTGRLHVLSAECLLALTLGVPAGAAQHGATGAPADGPPPVAQPVTGEELQALRSELQSLRRAAEAQQQAQEARIKEQEARIRLLEARLAQSPQESLRSVAEAPVTARAGLKARLYGFARVDLGHDSQRMFAGPHMPFWVLSPDVPRRGRDGKGDLTLHTRLTRLGLDLEGPPVTGLGEAKIGGKVEADFFGMLPDRGSATSNSRAALRLRHAYGTMAWKNSSLLFGQSWDLISPLLPSANGEVVMWNAGNLGDRRPQVRFTWEPPTERGKASVALLVGAPGAVDSLDLDLDQVVDGEESGRPVVQARAALTQPSWVPQQSWELGVWTHQAALRVDAGNTHGTARSSANGADLRLPLTPRLQFRGEAWVGRGLGDVRGGAGQSVNPLSGKEVRTVGGWGELLYQTGKRHTLGAGFSLDNPIDADVTPFTGANYAATGRTLNQSHYVINRFQLGGGVTVGADWMLFRTRYRGLAPGTSNRWNVWLQYAF